MDQSVSASIYTKFLEIHYNQKVINTHNGPISIRLKGKISCPVLNKRITPLVCSRLMDSVGWPRNMCPNICDVQAGCFIYKSIKKNISNKRDNNASKKI